MRNPRDLPRLPHMSRRVRIGVLVAVVILVVLAVSVGGLARFWTDYLWFDSVGFISVFRGVLLTRVVLAVVFIAIFFSLLYANLLIADRASPLVWNGSGSGADELVIRYRETVAPRARVVRIATALVFAVLAGSGANREWNNWDLFVYHVPFGMKDPQFHLDAGFYVFQLPFINFLLNWVFEALVVVLIVTAVAYYLNGGIRVQDPGRGMSIAVKTHLSVLLGALALVKAVGYWFERYELVLSRSHIVNGATATSIHADLPARTLLVAIAVISAGLFLFNIRQKGWVLPAVGVGLWVVVYLLVGVAYPALYQAVRVNPSALTRESPYIQRNIDATRFAYGLNSVKVNTSYRYSPTISPAQVEGSSAEAAANRQTLSNIRVLDADNVHLQNTFDNYQREQYYYAFTNPELDRYVMDDSGQDVLVPTIAAVRELNGQEPSGFVNQHLEYTHGYGAVVTPANENGVAANGTPNFTLQDIPPTGQPALSPTGAQVYYGEGSEMGGYVIADSKTPELDYQDASGQQVRSHYAGSGGVPAGGFFRRLAFAIRFGDLNFVLSGQINSSSRVMYIRNVTARAAKAAPFLKFDADPYPVVLNGSLYWILDAYTTTDDFPYAQNAITNGVENSGLDSTFNYVRNSVKVVVNAYNGSMHFFVVDPSDPIIRVYEKAFPDLFTPASKADSIIPGIVAHFRYPEDLFKVQSNMFGRYHVTDPADFFTQDQAWSVSPDPGSGPLTSSTVGQLLNTTSGSQQPQVQQIQPQYLLASLPGSTQQTFILLTPYVPHASANNLTSNMTAFLTASSGPQNYGQLELFEMPPGETVYGPGLVANAIKSSPSISYALTYLNQQGSIVELGEVAVVPLDQTLIYVQPIYVESSSSAIPTLKDVVVVYNGQAYQSQNASLDRALCALTNPDGSRPFASYCNTTEAGYTIEVPQGTPSSQSPSSPPSTTTTTTPATIPTGSTSVSSLLAQAQSDCEAGRKDACAADLQAIQRLLNG
jgi:uncharacterized membrane protein (UPF0182 family)